MPSSASPAKMAGKTLLPKRFAVGGKIQIQAVRPGFFHLAVHCAGDDVARRQVAVRVVDDGGALCVHNARAFAAGGFADEKRHRLGGVGRVGGMKQAGGMELDELHICDSASGAERHCGAVAGGVFGSGGVKINFSGAAAGEDDRAGGDGDDFSGGAVEGVKPNAAPVADGQVDGDESGLHADV